MTLDKRVDETAKEIALRRWVLPQCLHAPVAAVDEGAIRTYVGDVCRILPGPRGKRAFLVRIPEPPAIDPLLPISHHPNASIIHAALQVWVHVGYTRYRAAYRAAFPSENISDKILSHCMNRRTAELCGFEFVRIVPTSRAANSSSSFSEQWGAELRRIQRPPVRPPFIQYADLSDLMLMLDMNLGGGVMEAVNEGQALVRRPAGASVPP